MKQFKKPKEETIVLSGGHSLIVGHMPSKVPQDKYGDVNFGFQENNQLGLFSGGSEYNTFYPGVSKEDFIPKDEEFIEPVYRLLSKVIVNKSYNPVDFSYGDVLKNSMGLMVGQTVTPDHNSDIADSLGVVKATFWQEEYKMGKLLVPAGFNGLFKIDAKANPRIARGILMDPPSVHSQSVSIRLKWDKSHPSLSDEEFWSKLGTFDKEGQLIRKICTDIESYYHASLVSHGADPFAQKVGDDGKIVNPGYSSKQDYSDRRGDTIEYYCMDWKSQEGNGVEILNNTMVYNLNKQKQNNTETNVDMKLEDLIGAGLLNLEEGVEVTEENVMAALRKTVADLKDLGISSGNKDTEITQLKEQLTEAQGKAKTTEDSKFIDMGKTHLDTTREAVKANYKKLHGSGADETILTLLDSCSLEQLNSLGKQYNEQLEQKYPLSCSKCGSKEVNRASSVNVPEEDDDFSNSGKGVKDNDTIIEEIRKQKLK